MKILKGLLMIITAPVTLVLTLFVWLCTGPVSYTHLDVYKRQLFYSRPVFAGTEESPSHGRSRG